MQTKLDDLGNIITGTQVEADRVDTLFDSVGFAIEDFSTLRVMQRLAKETGLGREIDLLPDAGDPKDLFGLIKFAATTTVRLSA